jgi:hypothetical protein
MSELPVLGTGMVEAGCLAQLVQVARLISSSHYAHMPPRKKAGDGRKRLRIDDVQQRVVQQQDEAVALLKRAQAVEQRVAEVGPAAGRSLSSRACLTDKTAAGRGTRHCGGLAQEGTGSGASSGQTRA